MGVAWSQFFPPAPEFTEKDLSDLHDKVYMITGATSGIGYELALILYAAGATVWMVGRNEDQGLRVVDAFRSAAPSTASGPGTVKSLKINLADLATIKPAVQTFLAEERRLDVLFNNAGVSMPPAGSKSAQGHELTMATNCLGSYLLASMLAPLQQRTAASSATGTVRVVWTSSQYVELSPPKNGIIDLDALDNPPSDQSANYVNSKLGNWYIASEYARRHRSEERAVVSVVQNPGNLKTNLLRHFSPLSRLCLHPLFYPAKQGAYTELFAGLSPAVNEERNGCYIIPFGRFHPSPPENIVKGLKTEEEGGTGTAQRFWDWCDLKTREYA